MRINTARKQKTAGEKYWQQGMFRVEPMYLVAIGLLLATTSGLLGFLVSEPYMSGVWADFYLPIIGRPGSPIMFDTGVYLLVMGIVLKITFVLSEE